MSDTRPLSSASTCGGSGAFTELRDLWSASRVAMRRVPRDVEVTVRICREAGNQIASLMGRPLDGCHAMEIGPGQWQGQARYFATMCRVTGIDLDVMPTGFDLAGYWRMWRDNGTRRLAKTLGRKLLGIDRAIIREYTRQIGPPRFPITLSRADATGTNFPDGHFDFVYSFNVMEHIPDPAAVFRECIRVVKPGGVIHHDLHLYTCDSGNHDPRVVSGEREGLPYWPHLRPAHAPLVRYGGYVNKLPLARWRQIIHENFPGAILSARTDDLLKDEAARLHAAGELTDYSTEDLLTRNITFSWRKP
ncbi:MAG: class I SAM-dependent methyltransferase [Phycisphaeraceae bacterium]|nr:class I SAM-dependent methyltransferase [Phycisphaeraceae bacterium]